MPVDGDMAHSLAYRKNQAAIIAGNVPDKYLRILPHIPGNRILEIGSAEGVLACLLAEQGKEVTAVERKKERMAAAYRLAEAWNVDRVVFVSGDITDYLDQLDGFDALVAVRMIYYLGDQLDTVFSEVAKHIPNVVLCGNKNRAAWWRQGVPDRTDGAVNYYASAEGMIALLERHGYSAKTVVAEGDEIVAGHR